MDKKDFKKTVFPDEPGVYIFLDNRNKILYIGKATSLNNRLQSYFAPDLIETRSELLFNMVAQAKKIEYTVTDSVIEALILETNLIKTYKPKYNTRSKDDKSYNHLIITNEKWPRVLVVRGKDLTEGYLETDIKHHFGPFTSSLLLKEALKIVRKIFKYYDTKTVVGNEKSKVVKGRIEFNRQIGLYPESIDEKAYLRTIKQLVLFFSGKKAQLIKELEKEMSQLAKNLLFEEANIVKLKIFALKHIEDIALLKYEYNSPKGGESVVIEAYDVAHLGGKDMVGVMTTVKNGKVETGLYRKFKIKSLTKADDIRALGEMLGRRLKHREWSLPTLIVVDGNELQKGIAERILNEERLVIPVVAVTKNQKHKPERLIGPYALLKKYQPEILLANSEAHRFAITYHREKRRKNALPDA